MSHGPEDLVLPRPGRASPSRAPPIPGPAEAAFTAAFGAMLPRAAYLNTPDGRAAYFEIPPASSEDGSEPRRRVLFVHGVQTPALGMLPLARALHASCPRAHFVLVDLWGHGLSDTPVVAHEAGLFHRLVDSLLDQLRWPSAHVVGFSFGASLTAGYVASRASRVESFVLVAPAGLLRAADFAPEQQGYLRGDDDDVDEAAARGFVLGFLEGGALKVPADWRERVARGEVVAEAVREWQMREHPGHTASVVAIFRDGGVLDNDAAFVRAAGAGVPSLAILGGLDDLCSQSRLGSLGLENVVVIPEVGHGVVRQRVPEVASYVDGFWKKLNI